MSDRISIAELREKMKPRKKWKGEEWPPALFMSAKATAELVAALVEAAEAAHYVFDDNDPEASTSERLERLYAALARFDFGDSR